VDNADEISNKISNRHELIDTSW